MLFFSAPQRIRGKEVLLSQPLLPDENKNYPERFLTTMPMCDRTQWRLVK